MEVWQKLSMNYYSKYKNKKVTVDGVEFDSKKEAQHYLYLRQAEHCGYIRNLELQKRYELQPSFKKNGKIYRKIEYVADFTYVRTKDDKVIVEDIKGFKTDVYKMKKKMFEYKYPDLELVEL